MTHIFFRAVLGRKGGKAPKQLAFFVWYAGFIRKNGAKEAPVDPEDVDPALVDEKEEAS